MAKTEDFGVEGLAELEKKLTQINDAVSAKKALRGAMMFASTPMLKAAKANVPYLDPDTNSVHLRDSIGRSTTFPKNGPTIELRIGEKKKKTLVNGRKRVIVYGHILEFGSRFAAACPWLRPAFDSNVSLFLSRFKSQLAKNIAKVTK